MRARDFVGAELVERRVDRFDRALHVALDDQREFLAGPLVCNCDIICSSEPRWPARLAAFSRARRWRYSVISRARASLSTTASGRRPPARRESRAPRPASTGRRFLDLLAAIVDQRAHAAPFVAGDDDVADLQRAALHQHGGDRAAALVELGFDDDAFGGAVRIGLQVENFGLQQDRLEQLVEIGALGRRDFDVQRRRRPSIRRGPRAAAVRCAPAADWRRACRSC